MPPTTPTAYHRRPTPLILDGSKPGYDQPITFSSAIPIGSLTVQNGYQNTLSIKLGGDITTLSNSTVNNGCTLTVVSADTQGIVLLDDSNFTVASGGTLNLRDLMGATTGVGFFDAAAGKPGEYLNNAGTVSWIGTSVAAGKNSIKDTLKAPVLNTGTFSVDGGTGGDTTRVAATLAITGQDAKTNNETFYQTSGTLTLTNAAIVSVNNGYY